MSRGAAGVLPALLLSFSVSLAAETQLTTAGSDLHPAWSPDGTTIVFDSNRSGNRDLWSIPSGGGTAIQLTTDTGLDQDPDWSPGSSHIAYSDDGDIYVIPAGGGSAVLIAAGPGSDRFPAWSPDSLQIAYSDGDIWVVSSSGGTPVQLTTDTANDAHPTWSPDGSSIAFHSNRSGNNDIWVVPAAGGTPVQITTDSESDAAPDWSPDGTRLAFHSSRGGNNDIWVIGVAGGSAAQVTTNPGNDVQPDWGPGGEIVFARGGNLWVFTFPGSDLAVTKTVDEPLPFEGDTVVFTVAARNDGPSDATLVEVEDLLPAGLVYVSHTETSGHWDPGTGTWEIGAMTAGRADTLTITATVDAGTAGTTIENAATIGSIYNADPDPGNDGAAASVTVQIQLAAREKRLTTGGSDASPAWSPDGRFVAFDSNRSGKRALWTVPAVGGTPAPLTAALAASRQPDWSPEADAIVFSGESGRLGVDADLYRLELGGDDGPGGHEELVLLEGAPAPEATPVWSPDGTKIAYAAADDIWIVPSAGGTPTQLTVDAAVDAHPTWSPDGTMIAFVSDRAGSNDLWTIPADGGAATALTSGPAADRAPDWSPAGDRIAFHSDRAGSDDIWIVPLDGGAAGRVTEDPAADTDPDWAPNGSRLVFARAGDLWVAGVPSDPGGARVTGAPELSAAAAIRIDSLRPNPGRSTEVRWDIRAAGPVELAVYDVSGRLVRELVASEMPAGRHLTRWNGRDRSGRTVPAGVYFVRLRAGGSTDSSKLTLLR